MSSTTPEPSSEEKTSGRYLKVSGVHNDDIHGICITSSAVPKIISGSKDTTVKRFNLEGKFERTLAQDPTSNDSRHSYKHWVTALDTFPDSSFVAGHRHGYLLCRDINGRETYFSQKISSLLPTPADFVSRRNYKKRNENRVTGVKCFFDSTKGYRALIGVPEQFIELDCTTNRIIKTYAFDKPEWVYGFASIAPLLTVVIHGCVLSLFKDQEDRWDKIEELVVEDPKLDKAALMTEKGESCSGKLCESKEREIQRPYISSVLPCLTPQHLALSFFGGLNQILDVETKSVIHQGFEHRERVWQAVPVPKSDFEYATCADDKTIKIWDVRAGMASVRTYEGHPGRVSALAFLDETKFVAGTCSENALRDRDKGQFWFYDLRGTC